MNSRADKVLIYHSSTGVTRRVAEPLGGIPLSDYDGESEYILLFPSYGSPRTGGYVPHRVLDFLEEHSDNMVAVVGLGNITFGRDFCFGAEMVSERYGVPLLAKIDMVIAESERRIIQRHLEGA